MFLCGLVMTAPNQLQPDKVVRGSTAETNEIAVQAIPKTDRPAWSKRGREFHRQWPMAGTRDILAELPFVRGKNADATPPA